MPVYNHQNQNISLNNSKYINHKNAKNGNIWQHCINMVMISQLRHIFSRLVDVSTLLLHVNPFSYLKGATPQAISPVSVTSTSDNIMWKDVSYVTWLMTDHHHSITSVLLKISLPSVRKIRIGAFCLSNWVTTGFFSQHLIGHKITVA